MECKDKGTDSSIIDVPMGQTDMSGKSAGFKVKCVVSSGDGS